MREGNFYRVFSKYKLVMEEYNGNFTYKQLIKLKSAEQEDPLFNSSFHMVMDFSNSDIKLNDDDLVQFINHMKRNKRFKSKKRIALITHTPDQYVRTYLLLENADIPAELIIVSSPQAALSWLRYSNAQIATLLKIYRNKTCTL